MMKNLFFIMALISLVSCDFMDDAVSIPITSKCDEMAVVDEGRYSQPSVMPFVVSDVVLNTDCLEITIGASGCNPDNWDVDFIASEIVVETLPIQWNTKIKLTHSQLCDAAFQKTVSFDLTPLQTPNSNQVQISIDGWSTPIIYQY